MHFSGELSWRFNQQTRRFYIIIMGIVFGYVEIVANTRVRNSIFNALETAQTTYRDRKIILAVVMSMMLHLESAKANNGKKPSIQAAKEAENIRTPDTTKSARSRNQKQPQKQRRYTQQKTKKPKAIKHENMHKTCKSNPKRENRQT